MVVSRKIATHSIEDLERLKFDTNASDEVIVRTSAVGTFTPSGLFTDMRITTMDVSTTAIKLPTVPLANRNSMEIHNLGTQTLYVSKSSGVTADAVNGTTSGKEIDGGSFWSIDITDAIELYGIVASGSVKIKVTEVS